MADLKEKAIALLSTTNVPFNAEGTTNLYTVPTGKRCVLTQAIIVVGADPVDCTVTIGSSGTSATKFLDTQTIHTNVDTQYEAAILQPVPAATTAAAYSFEADDVIQITVAGGGGGATNTCYLYGFIY